MKIVDYIKDRLLFLIMNILIFVVLCWILLLFRVGSGLIVVIGCIWFVPLLAYAAIEYARNNSFYGEIKDVLNGLDAKYLLPEVIKEPSFMEGKRIYEVLKETNRDMHEHVNKYRNRQQEYREYIEAWVHEVKTPIASARLIIDNNESAATKAIAYELKHVEDYVEQVLYYSRSQNVSKDFMVKQVSLETVVEKTIQRNARDFIHKRIAVDIDGVDGQVYSDAKWLEFILHQLIGNAVKYSLAGEGKVTVYSAIELDKVRLTIEDNGIGIVDQDVSRVWEMGFTGENGRRYSRSTGIGLYLCKNLCDQLGIGIALESQVGVGTKVHLHLPG